jgi:hypothetical protein
MTTWEEIFTSLIGPGIATTAVLAGGMRYLTGRATKYIDTGIEERIKHGYEKQIKNLEAEQRRLNDRLKTRYSWLFVERAKALSEIHTRIVKMERAQGRALWAILGSLSEPPPRSKAKEMVGKFNESIEAYNLCYGLRQLLLDEELVENLDKVWEEYLDRLRNLSELAEAETGSADEPIEITREEAAEMLRSRFEAEARSDKKNEAYIETINMVRTRFRSLYGTLEEKSEEGRNRADTDSE